MVIGRPLVLLRFHAPEYDISGDRGIVQWRIQDGLLVSKRNEGYLEIDVKRMESDRQGYARVHVEVEIANFYPAIATWIARWVYVQTQSRIHVLVTHGFLRSLAKMKLEESAVGRYADGDGTTQRPVNVGDTPWQGVAALTADRRSARVIPATSTSASREEGLAPMELMKPWKRPRKRCADTVDAELAQPLGVGLALVAQRVEAGGARSGRRDASRSAVQDRRAPRVGGVDALGQEVARVPGHQLVGEEEALAEQLARRRGPRSRRRPGRSAARAPGSNSIAIVAARLPPALSPPTATRVVARRGPPRTPVRASSTYAGNGCSGALR